MPTEHGTHAAPQLQDAENAPKSDPRGIPRGSEYCLALNFNKKRPGLAAFSWVAVWRGYRGVQSRSFPLDAHGFAEALRGAATTILLETGYSVPASELEIASYKERRVNEYLRSLALQQADAKASSMAASMGVDEVAHNEDDAKVA